MQAGLNPFSFLVVSIAGWINQRQQQLIEYLLEENRVLREQIGNRRMRFTDDQRRRLAARAKKLLHVRDRFIAGFCSLFLRPTRLVRSAIVLKPSTLLNFHRSLVKRKYRLLFSSTSREKPGPQGPSEELIRAVLEMKKRNPAWGCPRIAEQIALD